MTDWNKPRFTVGAKGEGAQERFREGYEGIDWSCGEPDPECAVCSGTGWRTLESAYVHCPCRG